MKVGDLVSREYIPYESAEAIVSVGVIIKMSRTGKTTQSAQVRFFDGTCEWFDTQILAVINANR